MRLTLSSGHFIYKHERKRKKRFFFSKKKKKAQGLRQKCTKCARQESSHSNHPFII
jgi:hypothetical protein